MSLSVGSVRFATLRRISKPPQGLAEPKGIADKGFGAWQIRRVMARDVQKRRTAVHLKK